VRSRIGHQKNFKTVTSKPAESEASLRQALEEYATGLPGVKDSGRPSIIFLYSYRNVDREDPMYARLQATAKACRAVEQTTLHSISAFTSDSSERAVQRPRPNTTHDFRVAIGSEYFDCIKVNLSDIDPQDNPKVNCLSVPVIIVTGADGQVVGTHTGAAAARASTVFRSMAKAMRDMGYADFTRPVTDANKAMNMIYRAQIELKNLDARKSDAARDRNLAKMRAAIDAWQERYDEAMAKIVKAEPVDAAAAG
jgi:hypothetical protein